MVCGSKACWGLRIFFFYNNRVSSNDVASGTLTVLLVLLSVSAANSDVLPGFEMRATDKFLSVSFSFIVLNGNTCQSLRAASFNTDSPLVVMARPQHLSRNQCRVSE